MGGKKSAHDIAAEAFAEIAATAMDSAAQHQRATGLTSPRYPSSLVYLASFALGLVGLLGLLDAIATISGCAP